MKDNIVLVTGGNDCWETSFINVSINIGIVVVTNGNGQKSSFHVRVKLNFSLRIFEVLSYWK